MDLEFTPEEKAFRLEVRAWIETMPDGLKAKTQAGARFSFEEGLQWQRLLCDKGWVAPHWPTKFGGAGLDPARRFILSEELELAGTPPLSPFGLYMVGPLIQRFGNPEQQQRFLPKILNAEEIWCQGYSEPGAGSDLASLQMKAELDGDHFVVNGQKTWTTYAQYADWIFCLVRTDSSGKKQQGISFLLIDMKSPGVKAVPMLTISGEPAFCDTFFDDVRVPKENLLGPLGGGWALAKALLGHERTLVGAVGLTRRALRQAARIASETKDGDRTLMEDPTWRRRFARIRMRIMAHQMVNWRAISQQQAGKQPGPESSILKLVGTTLIQDADELAMDLMGQNGLSWFNDDLVTPLEDALPQYFCYNRAATIYAGSNEIQKNIIAKMILGLPRG